MKIPTQFQVTVLEKLAEAPATGMTLSRLGFKIGGIYTILHRMRDAGWVEGTKVQPFPVGHPVVYRLTDLGWRSLRAARAAAKAMEE